MYCTAFSIITVGLILFSLVSWPNRGFYLKKSVKGVGTFIWIILLCLQSVHSIVFPLPYERLVSAQPHPKRRAPSNATNSHSFRLNWRSLCLLRASHSTLDTHKAPAIERYKQTSILVVKLLRALWLHMSTLYLSLCKTRACKAFFHSWNIFVMALRCFYQLHWFYALCKW